ncbi:spore cortex-lytic enzyme [Paenibacillus sp. IB182496]|uniref:Spore cortex-lytic enzyme n=1 Tax=Paenibacillus sabuli TaxID=2772509 RepID=A0A927BT03_9BACL|nr:spore cortex-lytic enzyme [Paenibacillus sabuli]MBD2845225.1 spore cortex-lytic enzyme [Paenibacillus sabuli]
MRIRLVIVTAIIVSVLFGGFSLKQTWNDAAEPTFSKATLTEGASGQDVYELQGRLKFLGYYGGGIDGQFGRQTKNAVTWFQWKFGLKSDGIVGAKTKLKLWEATKNWKPSAGAGSGGAGSGGSAGSGGGNGNLAKSNRLGLSENDLKLMANAVYGEARGEPYEGQVAVAAVIINRVKSESFPNTVSGVIFEPLAFTAVADGQIWLEPNETARKAVQDALGGWDPSGGCLYYFNPETATSKWIWTRPQVKTIGKHIFCM